LISLPHLPLAQSITEQASKSLRTFCGCFMRDSLPTALVERVGEWDIRRSRNIDRYNILFSSLLYPFLS
jgi:hypothetical protein